MCLYPRLIRNPKYLPNKKNGGRVPEVKDKRVLYVPVGCQRCMECKKQKAREWSVRLQEEIKQDKTGQFVTLTFTTESLRELTRAIAEENEGEIPEGYELDNAIATVAVRRFLERWRKKHRVSVKHWLITELGHGTTEHVHIHGIIFSKDKKQIEQTWKYGRVWIGDYVNERTINYISKYVTKQDLTHQEYNARILTSAGIGRHYVETLNAKLNKYKKGETREYYTTRQGVKLNLPIYFRNKIYSEAERELLWLEKLDKEERWVDGVKISVAGGNTETYFKVLEAAQAKNKQLGYAEGKKDWKRLEYENEKRRMILNKRIHGEESLKIQTKHRILDKLKEYEREIDRTNRKNPRL